MRFIFFIIALALCFILGIQYGLDKEVNDVVSQVSQENNTVEESNIKPIEQSIKTNQMSTGNTTTAYKAANALASLVDFIYEIIVNVLYQISKLFY